MKKWRHRNPARRRGYALLMALVMLAITVLVLVALARRSLLLATSAGAAEVQLRQRWAEASLRWSLLEHAERGLIEVTETEPDQHDTIINEHAQTADEDQPQPVVGRRRQEVEVTLSGRRYRCVLGDENAKANLNQAYRRGRGPAAARWLVGGSPQLPVRLRPYRTAQDTSRVAAPLPALDSWGQVFDLAEIARGPDRTMELIPATDAVTCWGDGRLNVRTASDQSLLLVARLVLDRRTAEKLVVLRRQQPDEDVRDWLAALNLRQGQRRELDVLLTERSNTYSLWIQTLALQPEAPQRGAAFSFSVYHTSRPTPRRIDTFRF